MFCRQNRPNLLLINLFALNILTLTIYLFSSVQVYQIHASRYQATPSINHQTKSYIPQGENQLCFLCFVLFICLLACLPVVPHGNRQGMGKGVLTGPDLYCPSQASETLLCRLKGLRKGLAQRGIAACLLCDNLNACVM